MHQQTMQILLSATQQHNSLGITRVTCILITIMHYSSPNVCANKKFRMGRNIRWLFSKYQITKNQYEQDRNKWLQWIKYNSCTTWVLSISTDTRWCKNMSQATTHQKQYHYTLVCNFAKFWLILKILSPSDQWYFTSKNNFYFSYNWVLACKKKNKVALQRADIRMVKGMCGVKVKDRFPSKLRERLGLENIFSVQQQNRLWWYGCVLQKEDNDWVKKSMEYEVEGARPRGRPKKTWIGLCKLNRENEMDHSRWRKQIKDNWWSGYVWVGECFF